MRIYEKWQWFVIGYFALQITAVHAGGTVSQPTSVNRGANTVAVLVQQAQQYEHGEGVLQDRAQAAALYCQAAHRGSVEGQYALGWMYANGRGVERNDRIAASLFKMAASKGHVHAQKMLQFISLPANARTQLPDCLNKNTYVRTNVATNKYPVDQSISELVEKMAPQYELDPNFVLAVISVESGFNTQAVSSMNAQGLMQLIPETAERFQVEDVFDAEDNIRGGMAYLRWLLAFFKGDVALVAAAYNAGEGAVEKYRGIPPYPETVKYVDKILSHYNKITHPYQSEVVSRTSFIFASTGAAE